MEKKTLWATKGVHDLHESALHFVSFLVETAGKSGKNALHTLEDLLKKVREAATKPIMEEEEDESLRNDFRVMKLFARKATGGRFSVEDRAKETLAAIKQAPGVGRIGQYTAPGVTMADRITCKAPPTEEAAAGDGEVTAGLELEGAESESDDGAGDESDDGTEGDDALLVHVHDMDDSDYFLPNFKAVLEHHDRPESERERLMVGKFKDFIVENMRSPPTECVFVEKKRGYAGYEDCLAVSFTERGLKTEVMGDKGRILEKFEAMRAGLHQKITGALPSGEEGGQP